MAVTARVFSLIFTAAFNKEVDLIDDVIKAMATTVTYVPNQDTHDYKDDVTNEVSFTGYTAGGATLANDTITYTAGTNKWKYDADDVVWTVTGSGTVRIIVVYDSTPATDATRPLICYQESSIDVTATDDTLTVQWHADGLVEITIS